MNKFKKIGIGITTALIGVISYFGIPQYSSRNDVTPIYLTELSNTLNNADNSKPYFGNSTVKFIQNPLELSGNYQINKNNKTLYSGTINNLRIFNSQKDISNLIEKISKTRFPECVEFEKTSGITISGNIQDVTNNITEIKTAYKYYPEKAKNNFKGYNIEIVSKIERESETVVGLCNPNKEIILTSNCSESTPIHEFAHAHQKELYRSCLKDELKEVTDFRAILFSIEWERLYQDSVRWKDFASSYGHKSSSEDIATYCELMLDEPKLQKLAKRGYPAINKIKLLKDYGFIKKELYERVTKDLDPDLFEEVKITEDKRISRRKINEEKLYEFLRIHSNLVTALDNLFNQSF